MKKYGFIFILIIILTGCSEKYVETEEYALGTIVKLKIYGNNSEIALKESIDKIREIENKLSINIENSEISNINKNAGIKEVEVSEETIYVLKQAIEYARLTNSSFEPTIKPLVDLWGIGKKEDYVPSEEEIKKVLSLINYKDIEINGNRVFLKNKNQGIDLGGIAKGYLADSIKEIIEKNNCDSAIINLGGNIMLVGEKDNGEDFNIGIQDPLNTRGEYVGVLSLKDKSIVTSGSYERYFIKDNIRYHHILDTNTGYPADRGIISCTIISEKSIIGDALSTGVYVLGLEKGIKLIDELSLFGVEAIIITHNKNIYVTDGIEPYFNLTNKEYTYEKR